MSKSDFNVFFSVMTVLGIKKSKVAIKKEEKKVKISKHTRVKIGNTPIEKEGKIAIVERKC